MDKEKMTTYIGLAKVSRDYSKEPMEATWLDAVPFDKYGNPTGEVNEWVINRGTYVIADGLTEKEAETLLDFLQGELGE